MVSGNDASINEPIPGTESTVNIVNLIQFAHMYQHREVQTLKESWSRI